MESIWHLSAKAKKYIKKYNAYLTTYQLQCSGAKVGGSLEIENQSLRDSLEKALVTAKQQAGYIKGDKIRIIARNPDFQHPISTETSTNVNMCTLMDHIENIVTSNQDVNVSATSFDVQIFKMPRGAGPGYLKVINLAEDRRTKQSITMINNNDNLCGARAIVTALTYHTDVILGTKLSKNDISFIRKGRRLQTVLAKQLYTLLGLGDNVCFSLEDFKAVETLLDVQIKIVCAENFNTIIYSGPERHISLYLYKNKNHFDVINSLTGFYSCSYYCHKCNTAYNNKGHTCKNVPLCAVCKQPDHDISTRNKVHCKDCNRFCYNDECLKNHSAVCTDIYKCTGCNKICKREKSHKCGFIVCKNCETFVEIAEHRCYMVRKPAKGGICNVPCTCNKRSSVLNKGCVKNVVCKQPCACNGLSENKITRCTYNEKYIWFDFEAMQNSGTHVANLIISHDFNGKKHTFKNNEAFCKWLINEKHNGYTAVAHNSKAYDSYFILKYCIENTIKPYTIYSGSKLMLLEIPHIKLKIIDSSNFIAGPLADFPKTFGLKELKKGYFPHYFNTPDNQNYVGPLPAPKYYGPNAMKPKQREAFLKWHEEQLASDYIFDFQKEIHAYCNSDVDILRRGCLEFRKEFLEITNIDPFQYLTIASVCMAVYRSKYLPSNAIAVVEAEKKDQYSKASITWLEQFDNVQHALNGGEITLCGNKVDGYSKSTNTVYQYHGCFWHGCRNCYSPSTINHINHETMDDLYEITTRRSQQLKDAGYNLIEMWECEWFKSKEYKNAEPVVVEEPLDPRSSFFGGRTNASKLKVVGKRLKYIDVVSLYPTVQYHDLYPIGHPTKIFSPSTYNPDWFGLVKCKILPPENLYHPVLPVKTNKLMFALCNACLKSETDTCGHTIEERALEGCWTTLEISKALEKGYEILKIHEVWHFEQKSRNLFKGYVNDFMKIKLETSPHCYDSNEVYAQVIKEQMSIELDMNKIAPNPGKRAVAKTCLNSLWGKFGQRNNLSQSEFISDPKRWYEILLDDRIDISNCIFINDNVVQVTYKYKELFVEDCTATNVFIASFTTSNARLRLYDMLDKLGQNVVYYDTDSIVYIDDGFNSVPTGSMLGDWNNELDDDDFIIEWFSTGPKSYYYKTFKGKEVTKIKGFTLNYQNSLKLNHKMMKEIIDDNVAAAVLEYDQIVRDTVTKNIVTRKRVSKTFRMDYKKRKIVDGVDNNVIDTIPWGYPLNKF